MLIDSSAWVEYLRDTGSRACDEVDRLYRADPSVVAVTEPVIMELLAGATSERAFAHLSTLTDGLRLLPVDAARDYHAAAVAYRAVRATGGTRPEVARLPYRRRRRADRSDGGASRP